MYIVGVILVILGIVFFLQNTGFIPYDTWNNIWPILLLIVGLWFMFSRRGRRFGESMGFGRMGREDRSMGSQESRAYGHETEKEERMHDKREDEM
jgi:hypothetical protein